jgi:acylpyruvate hydrolase
MKGETSVRLARVDAFGGATVVVELNGRAFRTRHDSLRGALSAGVLSNPDPHLIEEVPVPRPADLLPVADATSKVICVGHNYREHILEMGHALPDYPNVFSKFPEALIGPAAAVALDQAAEAWDWEAELVFVIGRPARRVAVRDAAAHIAGYSVANDISARDWQRRGTQWLLGKTFEARTRLRGRPLRRSHCDVHGRRCREAAGINQ